jgi:hypothetical protein
MKRQFLIILILTIIFSCGQKNTNKESVNDTIVEASIDTSSTLPNKNLVSKDNCGYDNQVSSLGIGLIIAPSKFEIYNDSLLSEKTASWDMYEDEGRMNFCTKFFKPDYGIMHFVCIERNDKSYKVLVNFSDIKYLPNTTNYDYKSWDQYISQSFGIRRLTNSPEDISKNFPLRINPDKSADTLAIPEGYELFCPIEVKGDWIKVRYDCFYNDENNSFEGEPCHNYIDKCKNPLTGWLQWRQENKLLIDIFLMP